MFFSSFCLLSSPIPALSPECCIISFPFPDDVKAPRFRNDECLTHKKKKGNIAHTNSFVSLNAEERKT